MMKLNFWISPIKILHALLPLFYHFEILNFTSLSFYSEGVDRNIIKKTGLLI